MPDELHNAARDGSQARVTYFPALNSLRFVAAAAVLVHHIEQFKATANLPSLWGTAWMVELGHHAVEFFFVLSGFLITYLLMCERESTGRIGVKSFYLRRVLRIWPLYYLIMFGAFVVAPVVFGAPGGFFEQIGMNKSWQYLRPELGLVTFLYLIFCPNIAFSFLPMVPLGAHLWSIGNEEQFYALWPWVMKLRDKVLLIAMALVIGVKLGIAYAVDYAMEHHLLNFMANGDKLLYGLHAFFDYNFKIEAMAIGGIAAFALFYGSKAGAGEHGAPRWLAVVSHPVLTALAMVAVGCLFTANFPWHDVLLYVAFALVILGFAGGGRRGRLRSGTPFQITDYLGQISYGIYMFHPLVLGCCFAVIYALGLISKWNTLSNVILYVSAFALTIGVSSLSYSIFESRFLRMKQKLSPLGSAKS